MAFWLFKSEPSTWSWDDQVAKGGAGEEWDGVRNYQARNFMRDMALGDRGFFYHSQSEKAVVGIVEVIADDLGPSLRWAQAQVERISRDSAPSGGSGGSSGGGAPDPIYGDEEPF